MPTTVNLSLETFAQRGGATAHHRDGWGIAYYIDGDVLLMREASAAAQSATIRFVREHSYRSKVVIGHIRKATQGDLLLSNTQPFRRELGGVMHLFAHNGDLKGFQSVLSLGRFRPIGSTDSEFAFCALLALLEPLWQKGAPTRSQRQEVVRDFAESIRPLGPANFIYSDGEVLFVHGHKRTQPNKEVRPPGLWHLCRSCEHEDHRSKLLEVGVSFSVEHEQRVHLVASVPLTDERWVPLQEGELLMVVDGEVVQ